MATIWEFLSGPGREGGVLAPPPKKQDPRKDKKVIRENEGKKRRGKAGDRNKGKRNEEKEGGKERRIGSPFGVLWRHRTAETGSYQERQEKRVVAIFVVGVSSAGSILLRFDYVRYFCTAYALRHHSIFE